MLLSSKVSTEGGQAGRGVLLLLFLSTWQSEVQVAGSVLFTCVRVFIYNVYAYLRWMVPLVWHTAALQGLSEKFL